MKNVGKIVGINLLVLLVYSVLIRIMATSGGGGGEGKGLGILIFSAFAIGLHVFINLMLMAFYYFDKNKSLGNAWLLSSGVVLLVGFSTCLGSAAV